MMEEDEHMKVAVCGFGRAAKALVKKILNCEEYDLKAVICRASSTNKGMDVGKAIYGGDREIGVTVVSIEEMISQFEPQDIDVIIDFSHRDMAVSLIELCGRLHSNLIICTTNHSIAEICEFQSAAETLSIGIVYAPNLTVGINLLMDFVKRIARAFPEFNFEIIEKHPVDKPLVTTTSTIVAQAIDKGDIPIHSIRMDGYVSVHEVIATNGAERISIEHESFSRMAFANGAMLAADFINGRKGFFLMQDVLKDKIEI